MTKLPCSGKKSAGRSGASTGVLHKNNVPLVLAGPRWPSATVVGNTAREDLAHSGTFRMAPGGPMADKAVPRAAWQSRGEPGAYMCSIARLFVLPRLR